MTSEHEGRALLKSLVTFTEIRAGRVSLEDIRSEISRTADVAERRNFDSPVACWWRSATQDDLIELATEIFNDTYDTLRPF